MHLAIIWAQHNIFKPSFCYLLLRHDHYRSLIHLLLDGALPLETFCVYACECCDTLLAEEQVAMCIKDTLTEPLILSCKNERPLLDYCFM